MVTDYDKHWDNIPANFTSYSTTMLKPKVQGTKIVSGTPTIFIKRLKYSDKIEKVWAGSIRNVHSLPGKIFFEVVIEKEIPCPKKFASFPNGWYFEFENN